MTQFDREIIIEGPMPDARPPEPPVTSDEQAAIVLADRPFGEVRELAARNEHVARLVDRLLEDMATYDIAENPERTVTSIVDAIFARQQANLSEAQLAQEQAREREIAEQREATRQANQSAQRREGAAELIGVLQVYGFHPRVIAEVLRGNEDVVNQVAVDIRAASRQEAARGGNANSHSAAFNLLRHRNIPGSAEASEVLALWPDNPVEEEEYEELRRESDELREQARGEYPASTLAILDRLGLTADGEPGHLGQPVDVMDERELAQRNAHVALGRAIWQFLRLYEGDLSLIVYRFASELVNFGVQHGHDDASSRVAYILRAAAEQMVDDSGGDSLSFEDSNDGEEGTTADQLSVDPGSSDVLGRNGSEPDASPGRDPARRGIISL